MGEEKLQALVQESLSVAARTDAIKPSELNRVIIDTTVQPKNVMFPTDAKLLNRAREILVRQAKKHGVDLRRSYARVTPKIKREMRRRSAVEPVIGHLKAEHRMDQNYLAHRTGDAANAVLAAAGYNFRLLIRWLRLLLFQILALLTGKLLVNPA